MAKKKHKILLLMTNKDPILLLLLPVLAMRQMFHKTSHKFQPRQPSSQEQWFRSL